MNPPQHDRQHLLVYEPRAEGHHPGWLRFITEDLLSAGYRLSLAIDQRPAARKTLQDALGPLLDQAKIVPVYDEHDRRRGGRIGSVELCLRESGAESAFLCAFDEVASAMERRASVGIMPPQFLRGRIGGIYHRPRFMAASPLSPNRWMKHLGFSRLVRKGWLRQILFVDPYLPEYWQARFPDELFSFLPDPCPPGYSGDRSSARRALGIPEDKCVFLFYGVGSRRKGLHLATQAFQETDASSRAFLVCAGRFEPDPQVASQLEALSKRGMTLAINRYVSNEEEKQLFCAADFVLLPYIHHFGTSGVLSRAASAEKPVIASDEELLGRLVADNGLGLLFQTENTSALKERIIEAAAATQSRLDQWKAAAHNYADKFSRSAYRAALLKAIENGLRRTLND